MVIEEIDNGVHPSRAAMLLEQISTLAKRRKLRVLLSSHNPALLDALPDSAVSSVVFCYRDPRNGSSRLVRLQDLPDYPGLIAQGGIGHLMTTGVLERFVKNHPGVVHQQYQRHVKNGDQLLLPMATILETGNHVAGLKNGHHRRAWGRLLVDLINQTHQGDAPWNPIAFPTLDTVVNWLDGFPDFAERKIGFADVTIIKDWEKLCARHDMSHVKIWSLDSGLQGYDRPGR